MQIKPYYSQPGLHLDLTTLKYREVQFSQFNFPQRRSCALNLGHLTPRLRGSAFVWTSAIGYLHIPGRERNLSQKCHPIKWSTRVCLRRGETSISIIYPPGRLQKSAAVSGQENVSVSCSSSCVVSQMSPARPIIQHRPPRSRHFLLTPLTSIPTFIKLRYRRASVCRFAPPAELHALGSFGGSVFTCACVCENGGTGISSHLGLRK